jgi:hypothetical protein
VKSDVRKIRPRPRATKHLGVQIYRIDCPARIPERKKPADVSGTAGKIEAGE